MQSRQSPGGAGTGGQTPHSGEAAPPPQPAGVAYPVVAGWEAQTFLAEGVAAAGVASCQAFAAILPPAAATPVAFLGPLVAAR